MSELLIRQYYEELERIIRYGGSRNETAIRNAFHHLLDNYCEAKGFVLVSELEYKGKHIKPDGTVKDALRLDWGYWESKDQYDDLDAEIKDKFAKGYPPRVVVLFILMNRSLRNFLFFFIIAPLGFGVGEYQYQKYHYQLLKY